MSRRKKVEAGDLELMAAFEETITRNVTTIQEYTKETRKLVRELENRVKQLKDLVVQKDTEVKELRQQVSLLQGKLYAGGTQ